MSNWIDFKQLRQKLDFEQVLRHYGVEVKRKGNQHHGFCPLPNHNGKKNSPSFSANLERGIFQCFGCGAKGNILEFAAMMERVNVDDGAAFRNVALELQKRFCPELGGAAKAESVPVKRKQAQTVMERDEPVLVNAPLDFELQGLERDHPYLLNRGLVKATIEHFGLGFCPRGLMKNRVAIPLHDPNGKLVGYAGRVVDDATINEANPRYRFPGSRKHDGKVFEFRKARFLYNGFRIPRSVDDLVVVEGFASVWWLHQSGLPHVVATMGADCSERQAELIIALVKSTGRVWLVPDGDEAGERFAGCALRLISPLRFVRWVKLEGGKQPTDLSAGELTERLMQ